MSSFHSLPSARTGRPGVLCLHCSGSSGRQWRSLTAPLAARFDIHTPDLLGYATPGGWAAGARVTLDDEAERLSGLLADAVGAVHLPGHSYGGAVALQMALRWPERVASLTLYEPVRFALLLGPTVGSVDKAVDTADARYQIVTTGNRFALAVLSGRLDEAAEMFANYWGGPGTWAAMDARRRQLQRALMPKVHAEFQALFSDRVPASAYEGLAMPVRLIGGTNSPLPARAVMRQLAAWLPRASTVTVVGLNHMGPINAPERVRAHLPAWLQAGAATLDPAMPAELEAA